MSGWLIYFITRLDALQVIVTLPLVFGAILLTASCIIWPIAATDNCTKESAYAKYIALKVALPIVLICSVLVVAVPSTKEMAAIYLIPKIINNEQVQQLPDNTLKFLNSELRQYMKDTLSPESTDSE